MATDRRGAQEREQGSDAAPDPAAAGNSGLAVDPDVSLPSGVQGRASEARPAPAAEDGGTIASRRPAGQRHTPAPRPEDEAPTVTSKPPSPQEPIERYALKELHGRGGMGEVWLAEDTRLGREVAVKRLRKELPELHERFMVEAQITGQLEHPGVVPVHDVGAAQDGSPYYVMKFVRGGTLKEAIDEYHAAKGSPAVPREVQWLRLLEIFVDLCRTVGYAHSRGVLHRDLKPDNVMVGSYGETLVLDWGLARVLGKPDVAASVAPVRITSSGGSTATVAGSTFGTPAYMAPEMAEGKAHEADQTTDVYLLGATLYEILTGQPPRRGNSNAEMLDLARHGLPKPPREVNPHTPRALEAICLRATARGREQRYPSAMDLASDVQRYLAGEPVSALPEGVPRRFWRWCRRHRQALARTGTAVLLVGLASFAGRKLQEAERFRRLEQARQEVASFRQLAEQTRFYIANTNPVSERAPYYDPARGQLTAEAAQAIAQSWGDRLETLPLPQERRALREEVCDLLLLLVQSHSDRLHDPAVARDMLALLDRARSLREPSRSWYRLRRECCQTAGESAEANQMAQRAEDPAMPTTAWDRFLLGEKCRNEAAERTDFLAAGGTPDLAPAIAQYRAALAADPRHYWAQFQLGRCYLSAGRGSEAVAALDTCVALRPDSPWSYSTRGLAQALLGFGELHEAQRREWFAAAAADFDRMAARDPEFRPGRLNRGVSCWLQKRYDEALAEFGAVLAPPADRRLVEAAYYRSLIHLERGAVADALADLGLVIAENPRFRAAYLSRAEVQLGQGRTEPGLKDLDVYLALASGGSLHPGSWEALYRRAQCLRRLLPKLPEPRRLAAAELVAQDLQNAVERGGRSPGVYADLGAAWSVLGRTEEVIRAYSRGLDEVPGDAKLSVLRGWAYALSLKDYDQAGKDFAAVLKLDPRNAEACTGLAYIRARTQSQAEAQRYAADAMRYGNGDYLVLHNVACTYARLAQTDTAQAAQYEEMAMILLRREVELWRAGGRGPSASQLIEQESEFDRLRRRPDFQELLVNSGP